MKSDMQLTYEKHMELSREIERLHLELYAQRNQPQLAREAIDMFCPNELRSTAYRWLEEKGLLT